MSPTKTALALGILVLLGACQSQPAGGDTPALLSGTEADQKELREKIRDALPADKPVLLADDALTRDSLLVIERAPPRDLSRPPVNGRNLQRPETFRLLLDNERCWLERLGDGKRWEMVEASCIPAPGR
ncbi:MULTISPECIES: hypothetical protein [Gammaproteobacteria]|uniref:Lipoprotein n=1 Tax=Alloalcanivorax xenomutans TaxID=1094342 RepID=A0A9Q3ZFU2_9GAMM|nr:MULTISPECIES: hypothetical protein [Gammaproteobacteria]ARB46894.1 hypothetical protein P40_16920 [Alloalcanivorax xenomutans]MCE7510091.1 hypothetical protein [Alloalcanivorax xenomutans]HIO99624.1 hypothetical protein [Marinobacter salarius]